MSNVVICMLRGVNVGGHNLVKMETLRTLCESLGLRNAQTYLQSGNVIFATDTRNLDALTKKLGDAIEAEFGFRPGIILRTTSELREAIRCNPFAGRKDVPPNRLVVTFLAADPGQAARDKVLAIQVEPEELRMEAREHYIHFLNGQGKSKLPAAAIERALKTPGTGRNWTSVTKMLEIAEKLEAAL